MEIEAQAKGNASRKGGRQEKNDDDGYDDDVDNDDDNNKNNAAAAAADADNDDDDDGINQPSVQRVTTVTRRQKKAVCMLTYTKVSRGGSLRLYARHAV